MFTFPETDVKSDNFLFNEGTDTKTLETFLGQNPQVVDGEFELKGVNYPIMRSQPIPHPFRWNDPGILVETYPVCLTDFSNGKLSLLFNMFRWLTKNALQHSGPTESLPRKQLAHMPYALQK
jgi:hypothetical protein